MRGDMSIRSCCSVGAHCSRRYGACLSGGPMNCCVTVAGIDACSKSACETLGVTYGDTTIAPTRTPSRSKLKPAAGDLKLSPYGSVGGETWSKIPPGSSQTIKNIGECHTSSAERIAAYTDLK